MIKNELKYSYNDVTLVPAEISSIRSRSECNPFYNDYNLPIFTSPMSTIVNEKNISIWENNNITPIIPRNIDIKIRWEQCKQEKWVAMSLNEFESIFYNHNQNFKGKSLLIGELEDPVLCDGTKFHICVDLANGHMKHLYDVINGAKRQAENSKYELIVMTGNIANPETYKWICENADVDYIRVSIGTGNNCFVDGTKVTLFNGLQKNIEDVNIGEKLLTIDGSCQKVENVFRFKSNKKLICINNEITSTEEHKFYVINKSDKEKVKEENLQEFGYWVSANELDKNKHLLIKKYI